MKQFLKENIHNDKFISIDEHVEENLNLFVDFIILNLQ